MERPYVPDFIQTTNKLLSQIDEQKLFANWQAAREAGDHRLADKYFGEIATQFSPIVNKLTRKMRGYRLDPSDLMSEALLALSNAALNFNPELGFRFGTYASNCIVNTLYTYVTKQYFITNVCSNNKHKKVFFRLRRMMGDQIRITGSAELTQEIAEKLAKDIDVDVEVIFMMNSLLREPYQSLNQQVSEDEGDGLTRQDLLIADDPHQDDILEVKQLEVLQKQLLANALDSLDPRSRDILEEQTLFDDDDGKSTLETLGDRYKISKERARQIREAAMVKVQKHITNQLSARGFTTADILPADG